MEPNDCSSVNITKLVINNQTTSEIYKSTPLKTYSKKSPDTAEKNEAKSRYGRLHKRNFNNDFLSTDKSLSNYFNTESVSRRYYNYSSASSTPHATTPKTSPVDSTPRKRGRPRKSLPLDSPLKSPEVKHSPKLNQIIPILQSTDFQAPTPTSTETLPVPSELKIKDELSDDGYCDDADWNVGDLCWACIDGWPYWPGVITKDPHDELFRKSRNFGRASVPTVLLHVTFFGDNGLRSWVKINKIMTFSGLDDFQNLVNEFCGPEARSKDPSMARMFQVGSSRIKKWQAAVSEAESLISAPRSERVVYLHKLYPILNKSEFSPNQASDSPKKRGRKRKIDESIIIKSEHDDEPVEKRIKSEIDSINLDSVAEGDMSVVAAALKMTPISADKVPSTVKPIPIKDLLPDFKSGSGAVILQDSGNGETSPGTAKFLIVENENQKYQLKVVKSSNVSSTVLASVINQSPGPAITPRAKYRNGVVPSKKDDEDSANDKSDDLSPSKKRKYVKKHPKFFRTPQSEPVPKRKYVKKHARFGAKASGGSVGNSPSTPNANLAFAGSSSKRKRGRPRKTAPVPEDEFVPKTPIKKVIDVDSSSNSSGCQVRKSSRPPKPKVKGGFGLEAYKDQHFDRAVEENPTLSSEDIEKYLEKRWNEMSDEMRSRYLKSRLTEDSISEDEDTEVENLEDCSVPLAVPSFSKSSKRNQSLFCGIKNDRVCQVCLDGGEVVRCKGPCSGVFHIKCGENRPPKVSPQPSSKHDASKEVKVEIKVETPPSDKKKKGRSLKSSTLSNLAFSSRVESRAEDRKEDPSTSDLDSVTPERSRSLRKSTRPNGIVRSPVTPSKRVNENEENSSKRQSSLSMSVDSASNSCDNDKSERIENAKIKSNPPESNFQSKSDEVMKPEMIDITENIISNGDPLLEPQTPKSVKARYRRKSSDENVADNSKEPKWMCNKCAEGKDDPCFICSEYTSEELIKCTIGLCGHMYHLKCVESWPQTQKTNGSKGRVNITCPQHACHTCISDDPRANLPKYAGGLVRCIHCPSSFHRSNHCIPAGSEILSNSQIICPRHYLGKLKKHQTHVNTSWCQLCSIGGSLICCDDCPNSFHPECLGITAPQGKFICEDCETGRYPLYGEIVWVKLGAYRWWPARILFPFEVPENISRMKHEMGMFVVKFFGSHDHFWVSRGKTFVYHEGDGEQIKGKNSLDSIFNRAMKEAALAFERQEIERTCREAESSVNHKPPKYVRIQSNKLFGKVKPPFSYEVPNVCECTPEMNDPCGKTSDCINRMLNVECNPAMCPAKEKCQNQKFAKKEYPPLTPFKTELRGWGLKTLVPLQKGDFVIEYVGEMIDASEYQKRLEVMQKRKNENYYFLNVDKDIMIDAGPKGNKARFMNHSCTPNCETQKWTVNGFTRIGIFTIQDIPKDSELVFNYKLEKIGNEKVKCKCGSDRCSGFIGEKLLPKVKTPSSKTLMASAKKIRAANAAKARAAAAAKRQKAKMKVTEDVCFTCGDGGLLLLCNYASCPKGYHLTCLGLTKQPPGGWVCPWHQCSVCSANKVQRCMLCINSYCAQHAPGNISLHKRYQGLVCVNHTHDSDSSDSESESKTEQEKSKAEPFNDSSLSVNQASDQLSDEKVPVSIKSSEEDSVKSDADKRLLDDKSFSSSGEKENQASIGNHNVSSDKENFESSVEHEVAEEVKKPCEEEVNSSKEDRDSSVKIQQGLESNPAAQDSVKIVGSVPTSPLKENRPIADQMEQNSQPVEDRSENCENLSDLPKLAVKLKEIKKNAVETDKETVEETMTFEDLKPVLKLDEQRSVGTLDEDDNVVVFEDISSAISSNDNQVVGHDLLPDSKVVTVNGH